MFGTLFMKECKSVLKSIVYFIFLCCSVLFFVMQMGDFDPISKPKEGQKDYGMTISMDKNIIMKETLQDLIFQYNRNSYPTYPIGFYKEVILNKQKKTKVEKYIEELTGDTPEQIQQKQNEYNESLIEVKDENGTIIDMKETQELDIKVLSSLSYDEFMDIMSKVNKVLGGGSSFSKGQIGAGVAVPMTYEQALQEYQDILKKDKVTRAYARLFCDYMGILMGILPVFLAIARQLRDKKAKVTEVLYSKEIPAYKILLSRYLANAVMILIPLLLIGLIVVTQAVYQANYLGVSADLLAFAKYTVGWLMPTALFALSVGFLFTELSNSVLAALIQGIIWFVAIFSAMYQLTGKAGMNLIPRFNTLGSSDVYKEIYPELVKNRIGYTVISLILIAITIMVYDYKRTGGVFLNGENRKDRKTVEG